MSEMIRNENDPIAQKSAAIGAPPLAGLLCCQDIPEVHGHAMVEIGR